MKTSFEFTLRRVDKAVDKMDKHMMSKAHKLNHKDIRRAAVRLARNFDNVKFLVDIKDDEEITFFFEFNMIVDNIRRYQQEKIYE